MTNYKITRNGKTLITDSGDKETVVGRYISVLMLVGILPYLGPQIVEQAGDNYTLANGWMISVEAA